MESPQKQLQQIDSTQVNNGHIDKEPIDKPKHFVSAEIEAAHQKVAQMNVGKTNFRKKKSANEVKEQQARDENEVKTLTSKMDRALE